MKPNRIKYLIAVAALLLSTAMYAQKKGYTNGIIITHKEEKLNGLIKNRGNISLCNEVTFIDEKGKKKKYLPYQLKGFKVGEKEFVSKPIKGLAVGGFSFLRKSIEGKVNLYIYYKLNNQNSNLLGTASSAQILIKRDKDPYEEYYLVKENSSDLTKVSEKYFKTKMYQYFIDHKELSLKIFNAEYKYKDMKEVVKKYNTSTSTESDMEVNFSMDYTKGYVVYHNSDTIKGFIKDKNEAKIANAIIFKSDLEKGKKIRFKPNDISGYAIGTKYFESITTSNNSSGNKIFAQVLRKGNLSLFAITSLELSSITIPVNQTGFGANSDYFKNYYLLKKGDHIAKEITQLNFKNELGKYLSDNTELSSRIHNKEFSFEDMEDIVDIYNNVSK